MKTVALALFLSTGALAIEPRNAEATLAQVKRVYVDQLGGGDTSDQMRDMIISALQESGLFTITENPERADASLKGSSDDKTFTQEHQTSESIGFHASDGSGSRSATSLGQISECRRYRKRIESHQGASPRSGRGRSSGERCGRRHLVDHPGKQRREIQRSDGGCRR